MKTILLKAATALLPCLTLVVAASTHAAPTVTQVSAGNQQTLFVLSDGSLWGMGGNTRGELGLGFGFRGTNVPQQLVASNVTSVAAGYQHSLFLKSDGSFWAMGNNDSGQLGDGTTTNHFIPEQIVASGVTTMACGIHHSLFKTVTGHLPFLTTGLWGMGDNSIGALGNGTNASPLVPELLQSTLFGTAFEIKEIAAGAFHTLYRRLDGSFWGMGNNFESELGDGTQVNRFYPLEIATNGVIRIAAGGLHSLFIKSDGSLWGMGSNSYGELGDSSNIIRFDVPKQIGVNVTAVAAGYHHSLFIKSDESLWGMGANYTGQLGDGTTERRPPIQIVSSNVIAAAGGTSHSFFIKSDGTLWAMGANESGQLGDGTYTDRHFPVQVFPLVIPQPGITNITLAGTNLVLSGTNAQSGRTYITLTSTNLGLPLNQWARVATNVLGSDGNFSFTVTNAVAPNVALRLLALQIR